MSFTSKIKQILHLLNSTICRMVQSSPELYGRKQLGLYSNFFMNLMDPVSVRQNNERSPKTNIESGAFELLKTKMSTACSPILNDQSICKGKE